MNAKHWKLSRKLTYDKEKGKLFFDNRRYIVMGADIIVKFQEEMEKLLGPTANTIFYNAGFDDQYEEMDEVMKHDRLARFISKTFWGKKKIIEEVIENFMRHQGWGMGTVMEYPDKSAGKKARLRFFSTVFTRHHRKSKFPVCGYLVGAAAGIGSVIYGRRMSASETRCKCMGEPNCEISLEFEKQTKP